MCSSSSREIVLILTFHFLFLTIQPVIETHNTTQQKKESFSNFHFSFRLQNSSRLPVSVSQENTYIVVVEYFDNFSNVIYRTRIIILITSQIKRTDPKQLEVVVVVVVVVFFFNLKLQNPLLWTIHPFMYRSIKCVSVSVSDSVH